MNFMCTFSAANLGTLDIEAITDPNLKGMLKRLKASLKNYKVEQILNDVSSLRYVDF